MLQALVHDAEVELIVAQVAGKTQKTLPDEGGSKLLSRRQVGGGCEEGRRGDRMW